MQPLFDTHAHYNDSRFASEYEGGAERLLRTLFASDVKYIVNVGTNYHTSEEVIAQAAQYEGMYAAVGIHPTDSRDCTDIDAEMERLEQLLREHRAKKIVAVGEIGFDYYWKPIFREQQAEYFRRQMELAEKYGLPVSIHDRDAHGDTVDMIRAFPGVTGILHSCSVSAETVRDVCRTGKWYVSFSGTVTFKNAVRVREAAAAVPEDRLLVETDCPYLAPHPHRGELNHSGLMHYTVETLANVKGLSLEKMREIFFENAKRVFHLQ